MSKHQFLNRMAQGKMKGMINAYVCPELHTTITKNVDDGFIPSEIGCLQCQQPARTMQFQVNQSFKPIAEWYMPSKAEQQAYCLGLKKDEADRYLAHIRKGGLMSRSVTNTPKFDEHDGTKG